jgi:nitrite reductase/ring-hydroxylating ferredoxin subunit
MYAHSPDGAGHGAGMETKMLEYTREEISRLSDADLNDAWERFRAFALERQRLREQVQRMMRKKSPAPSARAGDIPEGGMTVTRSGATEILLAKVQGQIFAIDNACGHSGYPLNQGKLDGYVVTCRWHDAKFDVRSGAVLAPGRELRRVRRFPVAIDTNGEVVIGDEL